MTVSNQKIPFVDIIGQHAQIKNELMDAFAHVLDQGHFILGEEVDRFEEEFSKLCETRFALSVNSGTDALVLALQALGVGPGDDVITVPNSFVASASCIALAGARPVFVDVREDYNMDPELLKKAITPRTKAVIPVHLTGRSSDMDSILAIAKDHNLFVIEDCAQAILAEYKGKRVGSLGVMGCFSLHPLKTLNACGDGGVIVTQDENLWNKLKILRNHGLQTREDCIKWSMNSRLDTIQAAMLLAKLKYLNAWTEKRRSNAAFYQKHLKNISNLRLPIDKPYEKAVYHTFVIEANRRDQLKEYLKNQGVETVIHYPIPIHLQKAAASLGYKAGSFPVSETQAKKIISLPVHPGLTEESMQVVVQHIRNFYAH